MRRFNAEDAHHYLGHYSDGAWSATRADNGRVRIVGPGHDFEVDEHEVTDVKLTVFLYSWRIGRQDS